MFSKNWITRYSEPNRIPYQVWEKSVPRIHDLYADCVVYIYGSMKDAEKGVRYGGSGFIVQVALPVNSEWSQLYVVTNRHVVRKGKEPVFRINRTDGKVEYCATTSDDWLFHTDGDDIAVLPFEFANPNQLKISPLQITQFLTHEILAKQDVGIGDDTFMIGRFINHEGRQKNTPAIRFGNIAMMPIEKIVSEEGIAQESFLVETRSLPGYSGSPVFIYSLTAGADFSVRDMTAEKEKLREEERKRWEAQSNPNTTVTTGDVGLLTALYPKGPYLLGIDWCHLHSTERIRDQHGKLLPNESIVRMNASSAESVGGFGFGKSS